ncbi:ATAXIN 2-RELATED [Salix koriyanagi]|uniref:ATAXIN 2-RELATED n=1 Tax=Salix koriyanagi TaxID=2511006 RepID=A0A9Q1AMI4_9ROSI|nr:ATAXIN 2-RELATED [Salix koriyanagi]
MGYRNRAEAETEACLNEALLFATMCILGLPVDVYVRDGSVYFGTFHTASFDKENGIVLKEARLTKKGKSSANVAGGSVIETLVILSVDIVQVVAKGVLFPADGVTANISGDNVEAAVTNAPSSEIVASEANKSNKFTADRKESNENRGSAKNKNGSSQGIMLTKAGKDHEEREMPPNDMGNAMEFEHGKRDDVNISKRGAFSGDSVNGRQTGEDWSQDLYKHEFEFQREKSADEVHSLNATTGPHLSEAKPVAEGQVTVKLSPNGVSCNSAGKLMKPDNRYCGGPASVGTTSPIAVCASVSTSSNPTVDVPSESLCSSLANSTDAISPQILGGSNRGSKAFKLNPGAKIFFSIFFQSFISYCSSSANSCKHGLHTKQLSSVVLNFCNLLLDTLGSRAQPQPQPQPQPLRYSVQYHAVQAAPAFVPQNSQSVSKRKIHDVLWAVYFWFMDGQMGQLVYIQPVSHDLVPSAAAISSVSARPMLTPHQVQYPKHQGRAAGQTFASLCDSTFCS